MSKPLNTLQPSGRRPDPATAGLTTVSAPAAGTVKEVLIAKGKQADTGDLLVVLE